MSFLPASHKVRVLYVRRENTKQTLCDVYLTLALNYLTLKRYNNDEHLNLFNETQQKKEHNNMVTQIVIRRPYVWIKQIPIVSYV